MRWGKTHEDAILLMVQKSGDHQAIWYILDSLHGYMHRRWCGNSSINSMCMWHDMINKFERKKLKASAGMNRSKVEVYGYISINTSLKLTAKAPKNRWFRWFMSFLGGRLRPYFQGIIRDSFQGDISSHLPIWKDNKASWPVAESEHVVSPDFPCLLIGKKPSKRIPLR